MASPGNMRTGPRHPWLGAAGFRTALAVLEPLYALNNFHRPSSAFAAERIRAVRAKLERGETVYVAGIGTAGVHNTGVALVEVTRAGGPRLLCNNEEERFSGIKHTSEYPKKAINALLSQMRRMGLGPDKIDAWVSSWDHVALLASILRTAFEEAPASLSLLRPTDFAPINTRNMSGASRAPRILGQQLGRGRPMPIVGMRHHDCHAWFSYAVSPFAGGEGPVAIAVLDGMGDHGAISFYVAEGGAMRVLASNDSIFDSLGIYYGVISSTQGGWTYLSSEGRYMGAAAYGNNDRNGNRYYAGLREIFSLEPEGTVRLNRALANWPSEFFTRPYTPELVRILGEPIAIEDMWNPDAILRVEDIKHSEVTKERLDKAAATQMVLEDALFHVVDHLIRTTGSDRLILTGGIALNALANMRVLDRFDEAYFERTLGRRTRLHLWVPPTPGDAGVTIGAAYMFAHLAGAGIGPPLEHAFYCGSPPAKAEILAALKRARGVKWMRLGDISTRAKRDVIADLMAYMIEQDGVFAIFQGAAETGPRALGHRSIVANPCNPATRQTLNDRVKFREAIRPLAPMMTLKAAKRFFELSDGASDADYNVYNYMVLTAHAKPEARTRIPAVIHADGTGRLQIVRARSDPLTHAFLKALGRRIGVEVSVNTSFNVAGPIAQTARQAVKTLRRSKGMDAVLMFAAEGTVYAAWHGGGRKKRKGGGRFRKWLAAWRAETGGELELNVRP